MTSGHSSISLNFHLNYSLSWKTVWNSQKNKKVLEPKCNKIYTDFDHIKNLLVNLHIIFSLSNFNFWYIRRRGGQEWWKLKWLLPTQDRSQKNCCITQWYVTEVPNNDPESLRKGSIIIIVCFQKQKYGSESWNILQNFHG